MKYQEIIKCFVFILAFYSYAICIAQTPFITTWQTDNTGSSCSSCITIETQSGSTYNYEVDWNNDGTFEETGITGNVTHDYGIAGTYTIAIRGDFSRTNFIDDREKLVSVDQWGDIVWTTMASAFGGCINMNITASDAPILSSVSSTAGMFSECTSLNASLDSWDVTSVTDMSSMFAGASSFNGKIGQWNVRNVTDMTYMFSHATEFNQDIGRWDLSSLFNSSAMFLNTASFNQDLSEWDVENIEHMGAMFVDASSFDQDLGNWTFNHNVTFSLWGAIGFLEGSGLSCESFSNSLLGWALNPNTPSNLEMGSMFHLEHADGAAALAKEYLFSSLNWFFSDDIVGLCHVDCLSSFPVRINEIVANSSNSSTLTITFVDGTRPVHLTWENGSITTSEDEIIIPNLAYGNYLFNVVDDQFCIDTMSFTVEEAAVPNIVITEIMYNPPEGGADSLEFIKLTNIGDTPVDLEGIQFIDAITFTFPEIVLDVDESIHIFEDTIAAKLVYGFQENILQFEGSLRNGGEILELTSIDGFLIDSVRYANQSPWPLEAAGQGYSLVLCDYSSDNSLAENWSLSTSNSCQIINNSELFYNTLDGLSCDTCYSSCNSDFPIAIGGLCTTENGDVGIMQYDCQCIQMDGCEGDGLLVTDCSFTDPSHVDYNPFFPICDFNILNGWTDTMCTIITGNGPNPLCPTGGVAHNIGWCSFVAGEGDYSFSITPFNCLDAGFGIGIDAGIYTDCSFSQVIDCYTCSTVPLSFSNRDVNGDFILVPGEIYYVYIDGCAGSVCEYTIDVIGDFIPYEPDCPTGVECEALGLFQDCRSFVCPGTEILFTLDGFDIDQITYEWSVTPSTGWEVISVIPDPLEPLESLVNNIGMRFNEQGEYTVCWDRLAAKCCSKARLESCNNDPQLCKTIIVEYVEDEDFGIVELCEFELLTYTGPQEDEFGNPDPNGDGFPGWQTFVSNWAEGEFVELAFSPDGCAHFERVEIVVDYAPEPIQGQWNLTPCGEVEYTIEIEEGDIPTWSWPSDVAYVSGQGNDTLVVDWTASVGGELSVLVTDQCGDSGQISQTIAPINEPIIEITCSSSTTNSVTFQWTDVPGVEYHIEVVQGPSSNIGGSQSGNTFTIIDMGIGEGAIISVTTESDFCDSYTITSLECFAQDCPTVIISLTADSDMLCFDPSLQPIDINVDVNVTDLMGSGTFSVVGGGPGILDPEIGQFDPIVAGIGTHTILYEFVGSGPVYIGCLYTNTFEITIFETPTSDFTIIGDEICIDQTSTIIYTGNTPNGIFNWTVMPDDLVPALDGSGPFSISWLSTGSKEVTLTVERNGCISDQTTFTVQVDDLVSPVEISCIDQSATSVTFEWEPSDNASEYEVVVNGRPPFTQMTTTHLESGLAPNDEVEIIVTAISDNLCESTSVTLVCSSLSEELPPSTCENAIELCSDFYQGTFLGSEEFDNMVACGGVSDPYWLYFEVMQTGNVSFVITPEDPLSDIDFVLYLSKDGNCDPDQLEVSRCVMTGSNNNNQGITSICIPSDGATGLSPIETDVEEGVGCGLGKNGFVADLEAKAGEVYYLLISNFVRSPSNFTIQTCGSATLSCGPLPACDDVCLGPGIIDYNSLDTIPCSMSRISLGAYAFGQVDFSSAGDGTFSDTLLLDARYTIGTMDRQLGSVDIILDYVDNTCEAVQADTISFILEECLCTVTLVDDLFQTIVGNNEALDLFENDNILNQNVTAEIIDVSESDILIVDQFIEGILSFHTDQPFHDTIYVTYQVCDLTCDECKTAQLKINNAELEDITQTNFLSKSDANLSTLKFTAGDVLDGSNLWIYNRWGDLIYKSETYTNDWSAQGYPAGIYYYVLKVRGVTIKKTLTILD